MRAVKPFDPAVVKRLEAINHGKFLFNGYRNRNLRGLLFADTARATPEEAKRQAAKVTRLLGLLRAHCVIAKVSKAHRYQVSPGGRNKVAALSAARQANTEQLLKAA